MGSFNDIGGKTFGRLFVVEGTSFSKNKKTFWECICSCDGNKSYIRADHLVSGITKSCGCLLKEYYNLGTPKHVTHGKTHTKSYKVWCDMMARCYNKSTKEYKYYGALGVSICDRWHDFENFYDDMGNVPEKLTIDRYPNKHGNYEPGNCRWATKTEQARNTKRNVYLNLNGESRLMLEWAEILG